jgi:predicted NBD/HSP70 family sugar kinase
MSDHIAVDLGGTTARVAGYESPNALKPTGYKEFPVQKVNDEAGEMTKSRAFELDLTNLVRAITALNPTPKSVAIAVAGKANPERTTLLGAGNLVHWVGRPIVDCLQAYFGNAVVLGNDAEAAALAEAYQGLGQKCDFVEMIWGTGVGGCGLYWRDGVPYPQPMEPGHIRSRGIHGMTAGSCGCGRSYCLESFCGGDSIQDRDGIPDNISEDRWIDYAHVMAQSVMDILMLYPGLRRVIFTGGVICKQHWLLPHIEDGLREQGMFEPPRVKRSHFGESAGTHGALALGRRLLNGGEVLTVR